MAINRQDSRHRIKRSNLTGIEPTIPSTYTPNSDFTDGTWLNTDLREAEFFYNIPDKKLWIGTGETSSVAIEIGLGGLQGLSSVLSIDNNSGTYSIIMGTATSIKSLNGGAAISLDTSGLAKNIFISTDGVGMESSIEMTPSTFDLTNLTGNLTLSASIYSISMTSNVEMSAGKSIKSTNGGGQIGLDALGANTVLIDNAGGLGTDAYLYMNTNTSVLGTSETGTTTLTGGSYSFVNVYGSDTGKKSGIDIKTLSGTYSSVRLNNRQFRYDTYSTSAIGTYSIQTLDFMNDGQTISINVMLNSHTSSPDRNIGVKLFAVFIKYGGTIYQTGTTDNVTKDGYSDGTSATIDTDGVNIYIKFHAGSNIFYDINFAYDYLLS